MDTKHVYATWTIDNGAYRGIVVSTKTFDTVARTRSTYVSSEAAIKGARQYIDEVKAKQVAA